MLPPPCPSCKEQLSVSATKKKTSLQTIFSPFAHPFFLFFCRVGFWQSGFFTDFYFWAAGFCRGFCRRIFSPHFCGKKCPEKSSRKIPDRILQILYNKNPRQFSAEVPGQFFALSTPPFPKQFSSPKLPSCWDLRSTLSSYSRETATRRGWVMGTVLDWVAPQEKKKGKSFFFLVREERWVFVCFVSAMTCKITLIIVFLCL